MPKKLPSILELRECPYCEFDEFYTFQSVKGKIAVRERFDGDDANNSEMWTSVEFAKKYKTVHCGNCQEAIAIDDREE